MLLPAHVSSNLNSAETFRSAYGGWGCAAGTHLPENHARLKRMSKDCWGVGGWTDSPWTERHAAWDESVPIDLVTLQTGDCLLFSEK